MIVRGDKGHVLDPPVFEPFKGLAPKALTFTVADAHAEDLPVSFSIDSRNHQGCLGNNAIVVRAGLAVHGVNDEEGERSKGAFVESPNPGVQSCAKLAHR